MIHPMDESWAIAHLKRERDDYKTQRDTLIDDIAVIRANNERLERENEKLFLSEVDLQEKVNHCLEEVVKVTDKYTALTNHIRDMKFASPYSYNYIHLVNFIKDLERADDGV